MANFNPDKIKIGASIVAYKGSLLGATKDGIRMALDTDTADITCDQAYGQIVKQVVTAVKVSVSMTMLEIEPNLNLLLTDNKLSSGSLLGADLLQKGGELLLTPINSNDKTAFRFPNAVLDPSTNFSLFSTSAHTLQLKFTITADANGVFMEKVTLG